MEDILLNKKRLAIMGWDDGGAGQIAEWIEEDGIYEISCFINPKDEEPKVDIAKEMKKRQISKFNFPINGAFKGKPLISSKNWVDVLKNGNIHNLLIVSTEDNFQRLEFMETAKRESIKLINAIHKTACIMDVDSIRGENIIIYPRGYIGYCTEVYGGTVINTGVQLDHHNVIKKGCTINPGVVTAGHVIVDECTTVHTGAVIKNKVHIGENCIIGAGTVVISDIPDSSVVVGVPGKIIRKNDNTKNPHKWKINTVKGGGINELKVLIIDVNRMLHINHLLINTAYG